MKVAWLSCLALVVGCTPSGEGTGQGPGKTASTASASAPAATCGPNAYRHKNPDFCVDLPAGARGKDPNLIPNGLTFPGVTITWTAKSNADVVADWKAPKMQPNHRGTFEIWSTEPIPGGTYFLIHDATQHNTQEIFKIASVRGVAVVEDDTTVVQCWAWVTVEHEADARAVSSANAAHLASCKSLRVPGR